MDAAAEIIRCEEAFCEATLARDIDRLAELFAEDFVVTDRLGRYSKEDALMAAANEGLKIDAIHVRERQVRMMGEFAVVLAMTFVTGTDEVLEQPFFDSTASTRFWHLVDGNWRLLIAHNSELPVAS